MVKRMTQRIWGMAVAAAAFAGALALPGTADAAFYMWNVDANGSWTTASNWQYLSGGGPDNGFGYPNGVGDVAFFTGVYTAARTITLPASQPVMVGTVYFAGPFPVSIVGVSTARLVLNNGASVAEVTTTSDAIFSVNVVTLLRSSLRVTSAGTLNLSRLIEDGGVRSLTKRGTGVLWLNAVNAYSGLTSIEQGTIIARNPGGGAFLGNVDVGSGVLLAGGGPQFQPGATVDVRAGGTIQFEAPDTIGHLRVTDGRVALLADANVVMQQLTMSGGLLDAFIPFDLPATVTATSSATRASVIQRNAAGYPDAMLSLSGGSTRFVVNDGPNAVDLEISVTVTGDFASGFVKDGPGTLRFTGSSPNTYRGSTQVRGGVVELARSGFVVVIPGDLEVGFGTIPAKVTLFTDGATASNGLISVGALGTFEASFRSASTQFLEVHPGGLVTIGGASAFLSTTDLWMDGGRISVTAAGELRIARNITISPATAEPPTIAGGGQIQLRPPVGVQNMTLDVANGPPDVDFIVETIFAGHPRPVGMNKWGHGVARLGGGASAEASALTLEEGTVLIAGAFLRNITITDGTLGGTGTVAAVSASGGHVSPGLSPGRLTTGSVDLDGAFDVELNGSQAGTEYDQLDVRGTVNLRVAALALTVGFTPPAETRFTIIANDGTDPVSGTFANLPEGGTIRAGGQTFTISYRGGDGNDVVLTTTTQMTYYLAEGSTGEFFDDDVLIANPNDREAPITLLFMKEGGDTIVNRRIVPAMARLTVSVDQIPGLESTAASVKVVSDQGLPLVVERSMFWDASYYGGHTANAVDQPETRWTFAEGFQGFFDTYILIANAEATPTTATLTFLREGAPPVVVSVPVGAFARKTVYAGNYPELRDRAFGIVVEATQPVIAERAMYFSSWPGRLWAGGHANTGIVTPSRSWFHPEGATGTYFSTFILLSNPQTTPAQVTLRFLLPNGDVIVRTKTLAAQQRLTVNPAVEGDVRLQNAAVSTVVESDVPIVSERSMYWPGEAAPFGEGHNSSGLASLATRWGLAEGRIGGTHGFDTLILLANPSPTAAQVTITYLRDAGAPIVRTHTVPATSRFNVDVKSSVPELRDSAFGARIEVTNAVPIAVERSLYWNANGVFWAGGSNALGTPLP